MTLSSLSYSHTLWQLISVMVFFTLCMFYDFFLENRKVLTTKSNGKRRKSRSGHLWAELDLCLVSNWMNHMWPTLQTHREENTHIENPFHPWRLLHESVFCHVPFVCGVDKTMHLSKTHWRGSALCQECDFNISNIFHQMYAMLRSFHSCIWVYATCAMFCFLF